MMKKIAKNVLVTIFLCQCINVYADSKDQAELLKCKAEHERINPNIEDDGMLWYRTSASKKAIFNQINSQVLTALNQYNYKESGLSGSNAVVASLDSTIFDSSDYDYYIDLHCIDKKMTFGQFIRKYQLNTNPGMGDLLCSIQAKGIKVFILTNRSPSENFTNVDTIDATIKNLQDANVCYDAVLFANSDDDTNKNPRMNAIKTGDYENINTTKKYGPMNIIAYIGGDIQDFPSFKQDSASKLTNDSMKFNEFGKSYFIYPNPIDGSWSSNYWK